VSPARPRVLFISPDAVGERMAGLGIRYTELAQVLALDAEVVLATGEPEPGNARVPPGVRLVGYAPHNPRALLPEIAAADTVVAPPQWPVVNGWIRRSRARAVYDLYDPETLETLELFADRRPPIRRLMVALTLDRLEDALRTGHHFMCASEAQRDLWIGSLLARRLISPTAYDRDPSLRLVLDRIPFGVPAQPPRPGRSGARRAFGQISDGDEIVLWNGGIWSWLDPGIAVRAVARLTARRPGVRLVFMGTGAGVAGRAAAAEARALANSLGVLGSAVLFNDEWVPYADRAGWLLEADCALSTGVDHLETRFAFRTRLLDCFWAGLPIVCTRGDELAERVERDRLGAVVAPGDDEALAAAIEGVLDRGRAAFADGLARAAAEHTWPVVAAPLRRWVLSNEVPIRLGGHGGPHVRRPAHGLRAASYRLARRGLATAGLDWPSM
jgi:glycosyltransferase involved in cell wall biosynthesis